MAANVVVGLAAVIIVSLFSLIGLTTVVLGKDRLNVLVHYLIALATGALLSVVFFELLPQAVELSNGTFTPTVGFLVIGSMAIAFSSEKFLHWHHHHSLLTHAEHQSTLHPPHANLDHSRAKPYVYNIIVGDGIHNFVDGLTLMAAFNLGIDTGVVVFLGVIIHEVAQEFGDFGILIHGGLSVRQALIANLGSGITAIIGAIVGVLLLNEVSLINNVTLVVVSASAGLFLYLSTADLIPELMEEQSLKKAAAHLLVGSVGVLTVFMVSLL